MTRYEWTVSADLAIAGQMGFYSLHAHSDAGRDWMTRNVQGVIRMASSTFIDVYAYCDDSGMAQDIADGALDDGLTVEVNGREYIGANRCASQEVRG
jgi:hypothetical protein